MPRATWDPAKDDANRRKHGVSFAEAETVLDDRLAITAVDEPHSADEPRFRTVGTSRRGRLLVVITSDRGDGPRIISARRATKRERHDYETR